jgi:hypothetical protein
VADGVTIEGSGESSVIYCNNDNPVNSDNVTISNISIKEASLKSSSRKRVASRANTSVVWEDYTCLTINGDNALIENCDIYSHDVTINVAAGKKVTINNCTFKPGMYGFRGVELNTGSELVMNDCVYQRNYGGSYCIYSNGACKVTATNTVFSGWMSGWSNGGEFKNCTFQYSYYYVPYTICYGNTVFNECKFEYVGVNYTTDGSTKSVAGNYGFNYRVSGKGPRIDFNKCTYTSTLVPEYDGKSVEPSIYLEGQGDDKTPAKNVYIDGECIFPLVSGESSDAQ